MAFRADFENNRNNTRSIIRLASPDFRDGLLGSYIGRSWFPDFVSDDYDSQVFAETVEVSGTMRFCAQGGKIDSAIVFGVIDWIVQHKQQHIQDVVIPTPRRAFSFAYGYGLATLPDFRIKWQYGGLKERLRDMLMVKLVEAVIAYSHCHGKGSGLFILVPEIDCLFKRSVCSKRFTAHIVWSSSGSAFCVQPECFGAILAK